MVISGQCISSKDLLENGNDQSQTHKKNDFWYYFIYYIFNWNYYSFAFILIIVLITSFNKLLSIYF